FERERVDPAELSETLLGDAEAALLLVAREGRRIRLLTFGTFVGIRARDLARDATRVAHFFALSGRSILRNQHVLDEAEFLTRTLQQGGELELALVAPELRAVHVLGQGLQP